MNSNFISQSKVSIESSSFVKDLSLSLRLSVSKSDWVKFSEQNSDTDRISTLLENPKVLEEIGNCIAKRIAVSTAEAQIQRNSDQNANRMSDESRNYKFDFSKDRKKALYLKDCGNKIFGQGNNEKALEFYSQALAWIPGNDEIGNGTEDMAILHANRSAALFHLREYHLAQEDIELALKLKYPSNLQYKLFERSARCFLAEGKKTQASSQLQKALKVICLSFSLLSSTCTKEDENKLIKAKTALETLLKSCSSSTSQTISFSGSELQPLPKIIPQISGNSGKVLKNASVKLSLKHNEKEGRFVVATQDILPGEVILVEKAYVSAVTPEYYHRHCLHCFNPIRASIPCLNCSLVSFCSTRCRDKAVGTHHKYECKILGILRQSGISITCLMALRVLTQKGPSEVVKWYDMLQSSEPEVEKMIKRPPAEAEDENECGELEYRAEHFSSLCKLVTHSGKRTPEDFFQRSVMAIFLLSLLRMTSFIQSSSQSIRQNLNSWELKNEGKTERAAEDIERKVGENKNNETYPGSQETVEKVDDTEETKKVNIVVGTLLLRLLQLLQFNAHEVAGWDSVTSKSIFLGGGLYPTLAFFNHSCNPAIVRYFVNDTVIVRAVRTIQKGEPVTENYGPVFTEMRKVERQSQLESHYWFECACISCTEDWPLFAEMSRDELNFRCSFCRSLLCKSSSISMGLLLRCARCNRPTNILKSLKSMQESEGKYHQAIELMNKGRPESAVGILIENISLFDSILLPPFRDYHWCQEGLRKCYLAQGNETNTQAEPQTEAQTDCMQKRKGCD